MKAWLPFKTFQITYFYLKIHTILITSTNSLKWTLYWQFLCRIRKFHSHVLYFIPALHFHTSPASVAHSGCRAGKASANPEYVGSNPAGGTFWIWYVCLNSNSRNTTQTPFLAGFRRLIDQRFYFLKIESIPCQSLERWFCQNTGTLNHKRMKRVASGETHFRLRKWAGKRVWCSIAITSSMVLYRN